ncbi:glycosyl transferase family 2, partial [Flavobacterium sp. HMWF030]
NPNPVLKDRFKWNAIIVILTLIRFSNSVTSSNRKEAFTEAVGRSVAWWVLIFNKPKVK